jgi:hypothetical protein
VTLSERSIHNAYTADNNLILFNFKAVHGPKIKYYPFDVLSLDFVVTVIPLKGSRQ